MSVLPVCEHREILFGFRLLNIDALCLSKKHLSLYLFDETSVPRANIIELRDKPYSTFIRDIAKFHKGPRLYTLDTHDFLNYLTRAVAFNF